MIIAKAICHFFGCKALVYSFDIYLQTDVLIFLRTFDIRVEKLIPYCGSLLGAQAEHLHHQP